MRNGPSVETASRSSTRARGVAEGAAVSAAGILLALAFPAADLTFLAWVAPAPFLYLSSGVGAKRGAFLGALFGLGFFGVLIYWISIVGMLAWLLLVIMQSLFFIAFGAYWGWVSRDAGTPGRIIIPAAAWVVLEFSRSVVPLRGFVWGQLAQSQHDLGFMLRPAGLAGGWLVTALLIVMSGALAEAARRLADRKMRWKAREVGPSILLVGVAALVPLVYILLPEPRAEGGRVTVAVVQGNIPRYREPSYAKDRAILSNHVRLTGDLPPVVDLVVWPESSVGIDPFRDEEVGAAIAAAARSVGKPMIVGGNLDRDDGRYQVMAYEVSPTGEIVDRYQKTHLVPFGEFVPAREALDWIPALDQVPRDAVPGTDETIFDVAGGPVAPVISFEGDFGSLVRSRVAAGGRLVVVATNTSTWEDSSASAQHVAMSQVRAAENGTYVVHGALTGISAIIEPSGRVLERSELWTSDTLIETVRFSEEPSLYARWGDWFPGFCILVCAGLAAAKILRSRRDTVA